MLARLRAQIDIYETLRGGEQVQKLNQFYQVLEAATQSSQVAPDELAAFEGGARTKQTARKSTARPQGKAAFTQSAGKAGLLRGKAARKAPAGRPGKAGLLWGKAARKAVPPQPTAHQQAKTQLATQKTHFQVYSKHLVDLAAEFETLLTENQRQTFIATHEPGEVFDAVWFRLRPGERHQLMALARAWLSRMWGTVLSPFHDELASAPDSDVADIVETVIDSLEANEDTEDAIKDITSMARTFANSPALYLKLGTELGGEQAYYETIYKLAEAIILHTLNLYNIKRKKPLTNYTFQIGKNMILARIWYTDLKDGRIQLTTFSNYITKHPQFFHYVPRFEIKGTEAPTYINKKKETVAYADPGDLRDAYSARLATARIPKQLTEEVNFATQNLVKRKTMIANANKTMYTVAEMYTNHWFEMTKREQNALKQWAKKKLKSMTDTLAAIQKATDTRRTFLDNHSKLFPPAKKGGGYAILSRDALHPKFGALAQTEPALAANYFKNYDKLVTKFTNFKYAITRIKTWQAKLWKEFYGHVSFERFAYNLSTTPETDKLELVFQSVASQDGTYLQDLVKREKMTTDKVAALFRGADDVASIVAHNPWVLHSLDRNDDRFKPLFGKLAAYVEDWEAKHKARQAEKKGEVKAVKAVEAKEVEDKGEDKGEELEDEEEEEEDEKEEEEHKEVAKVWTKEELKVEYGKQVDYNTFNKPAGVDQSEWNRHKQAWVKFADIYWSASGADISDPDHAVAQPFVDSDAKGTWFYGVHPSEAAFSLPVPIYLTKPQTKRFGAPWQGSGLFVFQNQFYLDIDQDYVLDITMDLQLGSGVTVSHDFSDPDNYQFPSKTEFDALSDHDKVWYTMYLRAKYNRATNLVREQKKAAKSAGHNYTDTLEAKQTSVLKRVLDGVPGVDSGLTPWLPQYKYQRADMTTLLKFYLSKRDGPNGGLVAKGANTWHVLYPFMFDLTTGPGRYRLIQNTSPIKAHRTRKNEYLPRHKEFKAGLLNPSRGGAHVILEQLADKIFRIRGRYPVQGLVLDADDVPAPVQTGAQGLLDLVRKRATEMRQDLVLTEEEVASINGLDTVEKQDRKKERLLLGKLESVGSGLISDYRDLKTAKPPSHQSAPGLKLEAQARATLKALAKYAGRVKRSTRDQLLATNPRYKEGDTEFTLQDDLVQLYKAVHKSKEREHLDNKSYNQEQTENSRHDRAKTSVQRHINKLVTDVPVDDARRQLFIREAACSKRRAQRIIGVYLNERARYIRNPSGGGYRENDDQLAERVSGELTKFITSVCLTRKLRRMKVKCREAVDKDGDGKKEAYAEMATKIWDSWGITVPTYTALDPIVTNEATLINVADWFKHTIATHLKDNEETLCKVNMAAVSRSSRSAERRAELREEVDSFMAKLISMVTELHQSNGRLPSNELFRKLKKLTLALLQAGKLVHKLDADDNKVVVQKVDEWERADKLFAEAFKQDHVRVSDLLAPIHEYMSDWNRELRKYRDDHRFRINLSGEYSAEAKEIMKEVYDEEEEAESASEESEQGSVPVPEQEPAQSNLDGSYWNAPATGRRRRQRVIHNAQGGENFDDFEGGAHLHYPPRRMRADDEKIGDANTFKRTRCDLAYMLEDMLKELFVNAMHGYLKHLKWEDRETTAIKSSQGHERVARETLVLLRLLTTGRTRLGDPNSGKVSRLTCTIPVTRTRDGAPVAGTTSRTCYRALNHTRLKKRLWPHLGVAEQLREKECGSAQPPIASRRRRPAQAVVPAQVGQESDKEESEEGSASNDDGVAQAPPAQAVVPAQVAQESEEGSEERSASNGGVAQESDKEGSASNDDGVAQAPPAQAVVPAQVAQESEEGSEERSASNGGVDKEESDDPIDRFINQDPTPLTPNRDLFAAQGPGLSDDSDGVGDEYVGDEYGDKGVDEYFDSENKLIVPTFDSTSAEGSEQNSAEGSEQDMAQFGGGSQYWVFGQGSPFYNF